MLFSSLIFVAAKLISVTVATSATCTADSSNHAPMICKASNAATTTDNVSEQEISTALYTSRTGASSRCAEPYNGNFIGDGTVLLSSGNIHTTLPGYLSRAKRGSVTKTAIAAVDATVTKSGYKILLSGWVDFFGNYQLCATNVQTSSGGASDGFCSC